MRRNIRRYQFTEKKSTYGIVSCIGAAVSLLLLPIVIGIAVAMGGEGGIVIGWLGMIGLVVSVFSFFEGVHAVKAEETYPTLSYIGVISSGITMVCWIGFYLMGILL